MVLKPSYILCFLVLLVSIFFVAPSISRVSAGTYTINLNPVCTTAGEVPTTDLYAMYAFWPTSTGLNWTYGSYSKGSRSISMTTPSGSSGGYVALINSATGQAIPGLSASPGSSYIDATWSGWNPITKMFRFDANALPSGTYTFNYQMAAGTCGNPTYTLTASVPGGTYKSGQAITVTWNFNYVNQPNNITSPYTTTIGIQRGVTQVAQRVQLGTVSLYKGTGSATYTIPSSLGPSNDYYITLNAAGPALRQGTTSTSNLYSASNVFSVAIPPPTNYKAVCTGTTGNFTWTPPAGITNYYWRLTDLSTGAYIGNEELGITNITGTSFQYLKLIPGHNYRTWLHSKIPNAPVPNWSDAAYYEFNCPAPTPTLTPTPSYTPTPSPTPAGYCTADANCTEGKVCVNNGCLVPSPTPSPTTAPTSTPNATPTPNCSLRNKGDADCSCVVDAADYTIWRNEFLNLIPQERADFSKKAECKDSDGAQNYVCTYDLDIWRDSLTKGLTCENSQPTAGPTATAIPASTVVPTVPASQATQVPTAVPVQPTPTNTPVPPTAVPPQQPPLVSNNYQAVREKFLADEGSATTAGSAANVTVIASTQTIWNNGCMGCGGGMCTQAIVQGYRVVVSGPTSTAGQCIFRAYHFKPNATTMCAATGGRTISKCGTNPFPPVTDVTQ